MRIRVTNNHLHNFCSLSSVLYFEFNYVCVYVCVTLYVGMFVFVSLSVCVCICVIVGACVYVGMGGCGWLLCLL